MGPSKCACALLLALALSSGCRASAARPEAPPPFVVQATSEQAQAPAGGRDLEPDGAWAMARHDLSNAPSRVWNDGRAVFSDGRNWLFLAGATAYAFAANSFEDNEAAFFRNHTLFSSRMSDTLAALGNGLTLYAGVLTWYFWAAAHDEVESYEGSKTVLSAMTVTAVATTALKAVFHDSRPDGGSHDFPSGHASMSMSVAASLDELYGHVFGFPAYGLSALVGLQRMDSGAHDSGAVVFGWVLGYVIGKTVASDHPTRVLGLDLGVTYDEENGAPAISLSRDW